jgi:mRNA interferase HigB
MRIITRRRLNEYAKLHPNAAVSLSAWHALAKKSVWRSLQEVRKSFPNADPVTVASGKTVTIFNIAGNHHRLITAVHYDTGKIFILEILTHADYSKNRWKKLL